MQLFFSVSETSKESEWHGCKIVRDNLDMNSKPCHMTSENKTRSLHCFHLFAVRDCIDFSCFSSDPPTPPSSTCISTEHLLPSDAEHDQLFHNLTVLVSQILVDNIPHFKTTFKDVVIKHIPHKYSSELTKKSELAYLL